jgi:hypothetical protein
MSEEVSLVNRSAGVAALTLAGVLVAGGTAAALNTSVLTAALPGSVGNADAFLPAVDTSTPSPASPEPTPAGVALTPSPEPDTSDAEPGVVPGQDTPDQTPASSVASVRRTTSAKPRSSTTVRPAQATSTARATHWPTHRPTASASPRRSEHDSPDPHPSETKPGPVPTKPSDD